MFALREINQMEREMCSHEESQLNVDSLTLRDFQCRIQHDLLERQYPRVEPGKEATTLLPVFRGMT